MTSDSVAASAPAPHDDEPHDRSVNSRLNWLRAGVLGANDGIVSTAGLVVGVAGATSDRQAILIAGVAGLFAGAMSMAAGEYVSVSSQRDAQTTLIAKERAELASLRKQVRELKMERDLLKNSRERRRCFREGSACRPETPCRSVRLRSRSGRHIFGASSPLKNMARGWLRTCDW